MTILNKTKIRLNSLKRNTDVTWILVSQPSKGKQSTIHYLVASGSQCQFHHGWFFLLVIKSLQ